MSLLNLLQQHLGLSSPQVRPLPMNGGIKQSAPMSQPQMQQLNAKMEADGARAFNQAHPGQVYKTNQNNEFGAGQLPNYMPAGQANYVGYRQAPKPITIQTSMPKPVVQFSARSMSNFAPNGNNIQ